jgi:hypothetical protein
MAQEPLRFADPTRKDVLLANGPISVAALGDLQVLTFTQIAPRVDGVSPGVSSTTYEMVVLCRVALRREQAAELANLIAKQAVASVETSGNA